jgi:hypothetical protein
MDTHQSHQVAFDTPSWYRIRVSGILGAEWGERLTGLTIRCRADEDDSPTTILEGELADQAALMGVLHALYDLHLPVLSVTCRRVRGGHR